jgi:predicted amidophosphoribosyltransferase
MKGTKERDKCPYCKEDIAGGAVVCKHCHSIINVPPPKKKKKAPFWRNMFMLGFYSGIVVSALLIYFYSKIF